MAEVGTDETTGTETVIITHGEMVQGKEAHILREIIALARLQCRTDTQRMIRKRRKRVSVVDLLLPLLCSITDIICLNRISPREPPLRYPLMDHREHLRLRPNGSRTSRDMELDIPPSPPPVEITLAERRASARPFSPVRRYFWSSPQSGAQSYARTWARI